MWWIQLAAHMEEMQNVCSILVDKSEGNISLGTCKDRWEDTFKM
jgi:hypothetical protein